MSSAAAQPLSPLPTITTSVWPTRSVLDESRPTVSAATLCQCAADAATAGPVTDSHGKILVCGIAHQITVGADG